MPKPITPIDLLNALITCLSPNELKPDCVPPSKTPTLRSGHVLLVEDNAINQLLARTMLEQMGITVTIAQHGIEALDILRRENNDCFDAIFMDCQMPEMDGYETTSCIRLGEVGETLKQIPIIAMTANAIKGDREKCLDSGMDDYMSKPIHVDTLRQQIERWLKP